MTYHETKESFCIFGSNRTLLKEKLAIQRSFLGYSKLCIQSLLNHLRICKILNPLGSKSLRICFAIVYLMANTIHDACTPRLFAE